MAEPQEPPQRMTPQEEQEEALLYEGLEEFFNQELADSIEKRIENRPSAPFRTDPNQEPFGEDDKYIPLVEGVTLMKEGEKDPLPEAAALEAPKTSHQALRQLNILLNVLTKGSSRLAVQYRRGCTKKDLVGYTSKFDLLKGNLWELLECLAPLRRGDVWRCATYGDTLYHTPFAHGNVFHNPLERKKLIEQETAEKLKLLEEINKERGRRPTLLRVADCERIIGEFGQIIKHCGEQRDAIQILLQLHTHEKSSQELVNYLRANVGTLTRQVKQQDEQIQELKKQLTHQGEQIKVLKNISAQQCKSSNDVDD